MNLYDILKELNISYEETEHEPVYTVADIQALENYPEGTGCKNLLLRDAKKTAYLLLILEENKKADVKAVAEFAKTSRLSFASADNLMALLGLEPGAVSPFGIINDTENKVILIIDDELIGQKLVFHPNVNTKSLSIHYDDLIKFIEHQKHRYLIYKV